MTIQAHKNIKEKNLQNTVPQICVIEDFNGEKIVGTLYEKGFQKKN